MNGEDGIPCSDKLEQGKRKKMSSGLQIECPGSIQNALRYGADEGYHFIVTYIVHPRYTRNLLSKNPPSAVGRTDRILTGTDWSRLIVGMINQEIDVDSEVEHIRASSVAIFSQEMGFAIHLGLPAILLSLRHPNNVNLGRLLNDRLIGGFNCQIWVKLPMVHPSRYSPLCEDDVQDSWEWWNDLRRYCNYDKRLGLVLEMPDVKHIPSPSELDRWIGEPIKALSISTTLFLENQHKQPVLSKAHQDIIQQFMALDVQYILHGSRSHGHGHRQYCAYINFLGKKLFKADTMSDFVQGCEDYLQNPLQPLTEHLESHIYEVFEKDQVKYVEYQNAIQKALQDVPNSIETPVVMVVGAGRGPLVQAALNASYILHRKIKVYAVEKNPYAVNTLWHRVKYEWKDQVTLVHQDMRTYEPPEKADILVSELLGSFGDNELSPECLDGAQRFVKQTGISIPSSYTSFLAPLQSTKLYNEIKGTRMADKPLESCYEMPYVVHLVNFYQIAKSQPLFTFKHPNWDLKKNERFAKLRFHCEQNCVLTGFAGYFETVLYKDVMLSINPQTHSPNMVSWFPIMFPLSEPVQVKGGSVIEVAFWRSESSEKVWYQWCLEAPIKGTIHNPNGRSYFIKKN